MRAGAKQIKNTMNVPQKARDLLELTMPTTDTAATMAAQAPVLKAKMDGIHPSLEAWKTALMPSKFTAAAPAKRPLPTWPLSRT